MLEEVSHACNLRLALKTVRTFFTCVPVGPIFPVNEWASRSVSEILVFPEQKVYLTDTFNKLFFLMWGEAA